MRVSSGDWYKVDDKIKIGKNGKLSAEYFSGIVRCADFVGFDGAAKTNHIISSEVYYEERHWYWRTDEVYSIYAHDLDVHYRFYAFVLK